ncbi:MAG: NAD(P)/FAD-dependent oxidoreductase [Acidimicrobiales bacterium]
MPTVSLRSPWRGAVPATERSPWLREALRREVGPGPRSLQESLRCDVCIVGGGYSGMWTALELRARHPSLEIVVLEGDVCGGGASGTNAGYLGSLWPKMKSLRAMTTSEEAGRIVDASSQAVEAIVAFCDEHSIKAQLRRSPHLWVASNAAQLAALDKMSRLPGLPFRRLTREEAIEATGSGVHMGGLADEAALTVQPALLARGLRRVALEEGIQVYEQTPVVLLRSMGGVTVTTECGAVVRAERVALTINAWACELPGLSDSMVLLASDSLLTTPVPDRLEQLGLGQGFAASDVRRRLNYYRTTGDGRLLFGKGAVDLRLGSRLGGTAWGPSNRLRLLRRHMDRLYPSLANDQPAFTWTAPVEYSTTSLPFCDQVPGVPGAWYATGYSGSGIGPSRLLARILASLLAGDADEWRSSVLVGKPSIRLPPEPVRWLGGQFVRLALARSESVEDRGNSPSALVRRAAAADPTTFSAS